MSNRVLVIGATGLLGAPVARALAEAGQEVRVLARDPDKARGRFPGHDLVRGDVTDAASVRAALEGCRGVHVSLRGTDLEDSRRVEVEGSANVARAAADTGALMTLLSNNGMTDALAGELPFIAMKMEAERRARDSGARHVILRCTHFMDSLPLFVRGKAAQIVGRQPHRYSYLAAGDFGRMVAAAHAEPDPQSGVYDVLGPEPLTMKEAVTRYVAVRHPGMKVGEVPLPMVRLVATLSRNAELKRVALLFSAFQKIPETGDPAPAWARFGRPATTLQEWAATTA